MHGRDGRLSWLGDVITHIQDEAVGPAPSIEHVISRIMGAPDSDVALTLERKQGRLERCEAVVAASGHAVAGASKRSPGQARAADQVGALNLARAMPAPSAAGAPALAPQASPVSPPPSTTPVQTVAADPLQTASPESQSAVERGCERASLMGSQQHGAPRTAAEAGAGDAWSGAGKDASSSARPAMTFEEVMLLDAR